MLNKKSRLIQKDLYKNSSNLTTVLVWIFMNKYLLTSDIWVSVVLIIFSSMGRSTRDNNVSVISIYILFIVALRTRGHIRRGVAI